MGGGRVLTQPRAQIQYNSSLSAKGPSAGRSSNSSGGSEETHPLGIRGNSKVDCPRWPHGALQVVEAQLGLLSASCSGEEQQQGAGDNQSPSPKRTRWGRDDDESRPRVHIDLEPQQPALPYGWEQFLDINTGEVYYIDWSTCKRTCRDPREVLRLADDKIRAVRQVGHHRHEGSQSHEAWASSQGQVAVAPSSSSSSSGSAVFPPQEHQHYQRQHQPEEDDDDQDHNEASSSRSMSSCSEQENVMVALGCHRCLTYFMLPRLNPTCPRCGAHLKVKH